MVGRQRSYTTCANYAAIRQYLVVKKVTQMFEYQQNLRSNLGPYGWKAEILYHLCQLCRH